VACGRTAATLWGVELAGRSDDVEVVAPVSSGHDAIAGVRVTRRALSPGEITRRRGIPVTTPVRTALDLARIHPLDDAVVAVDQFLRPGLVFLDEVRTAAATRTGRDCRRVRAVLHLADGLAESPQETRLRLLLHRSTLPRPVAQHRIHVGDVFVARVDFGWPDARLAVEYDGAWHGERQQVAKDRRRLNQVTAAGWRVIFVTAADLRHPERLIARVQAALAQSPRSA
jgi:very-short-patch-repair endonuclease